MFVTILDGKFAVNFNNDGGRTRVFPADGEELVKEMIKRAVYDYSASSSVDYPEEDGWVGSSTPAKVIKDQYELAINKDKDVLTNLND